MPLLNLCKSAYQGCCSVLYSAFSPVLDRFDVAEGGLEWDQWAEMWVPIRASTLAFKATDQPCKASSSHQEVDKRPMEPAGDACANDHYSTKAQSVAAVNKQTQTRAHMQSSQDQTNSNQAECSSQQPSVQDPSQDEIAPRPSLYTRIHQFLFGQSLVQLGFRTFELVVTGITIAAFCLYVFPPAFMITLYFQLLPLLFHLLLAHSKLLCLALRKRWQKMKVDRNERTA